MNKTVPGKEPDTPSENDTRVDIVVSKSPRSPLSISTSPPPTPRRFSTSSTRSYETTEYFPSSPVNQRVSTTISLHGYNRKHHHTRRISINSSMSIFSTMSETSLPWTTKDIGFNAISGVLNNPNNNPYSSSAKPSKYEIPVVPHTSIRKVKPVEFANYIKSIEPVFERYYHNKRIGAERQKIGRSSSLSSSVISPSVSATNLLVSNLTSLPSPESEDVPVHRLASSRNPYSVNVPSSPLLAENIPQKEEGPAIELPLLESVPPIYFEEDFNLENPRTFDIVCEQADVIGSNPEISTNALLQEKLAHYLDTVEIHLVKEISKRSSSFFAALSNLQALHSETLECVAQINALRGKLVIIEDSEVKQGLEVVRLKRRRANLGKLYEGIRMVSEIHSTQPMIQILLSQGDYFSALELLEESDRILKGGNVFEDQSDETSNSKLSKSPHPLIRRLSNVSESLKSSGLLDLRGVRALIHYKSQLADLHKTIGVMAETDLLNMIFLDLNEHIENINKDEGIRSLYNSTQSTSQFQKKVTVASDLHKSNDKLDKEIKLRERVAPLIVGLYKMNRLGTTLQIYRERLLKEIKKIIQRHYPSFTLLNSLQEEQQAELKGESSMNDIAKMLKGMTFDSFMEIFLAIYAVLLEGMKRVAVYNEIFISILEDLRVAGVEVPKKIEELDDDIKEEKVNERLKGKVSQKLKEEKDSERLKETLENTIKDSQNEKKELVEEADDNDKSLLSSNVSTTKSKLYAQKFTIGIKSIIQKASSSATKTLSPTSIITSTDSTTNNLNSESNKQTESQTPIANTINSSSTSTISTINDSYSQLITESSEIVFAAADLVHVRCANLIGMRAEQNARLNPKDFYRLFNVTWDFILEGENLCGHMCFGLRGTIMSQAKSFLNHFHMEKMNSAASGIDNEQWVQTGVPVEFQRIVNRIIAASSSGMSEFKDNLLVDPSLTNPLSPNISSSYIFMEDQKKFVVVSCSLMLLKTLGEYLRCMANIPVLTTDAMNKIVEILNLFNSRTCQVILGAGALESAGLKNITAKHLALASQSLGLMIALIPFIRECIRHNLNTKQAVMLTEFDRIKGDYMNHQNEIHTKLVSIMNQRLSVYLESFQTVKWNEPSENVPNPYMERLVKETLILHKVLRKFLPLETVQKVMSEVFVSFNAKLAQEISQIEISTLNGKKRLLLDIRLYTHKFSNLEGIAGPKNDLEMLVNNLSVSENNTAKRGDDISKD
ncbi:11264_t:CDS:10 [Ambispora gerdemannii]|uniref:Vacuolar protein sorting-associated protein 54 n=1 Tax=Ambispora gerdemannii TaxID=144530 RepID=A0A9N8YK30_9GLOM|nr:11264_t:CDS:10 [Ambispora gerdemannii]